MAVEVVVALVRWAEEEGCLECGEEREVGAVY